MSVSIRSITIATALLAIPALVAAQAKGVELGLDAGLDYKINSPHVTTIGVPIQDFRVGLGINDRVSIEPRFSFNYIKVEGASAAWTFSAGGGVLFHLTDFRKGIYLRPFIRWDHIDLGGTSASQFGAGGGIGYKMGTGKVIGRLEAAYAHAFKNDNFTASDDLLLLFGFSFFTH